MTAFTSSEFSRPAWRMILLATLAFWLSGSLLLDAVIMPSMYAAGMMTQPGFASAGYSLFWVFNHLEVLCAALALTGVLILRNTIRITTITRWAIPMALGLLAIALTYTYILTPEMSALGMQLNWFDGAAVPTTMNQMHSSYWLLEVLKFSVGGALLSAGYKMQG